MLKSAIAMRHIHFENLGTFEAVLAGAGYKLHYHDIGVDSLSMLDPVQPDLLVVLGGPVGVYDDDAYPFLSWERALLSRRLAAGRPTFGICLGAQQMAAALGAKVAPTGIKEIGFSPLTLTTSGWASPLRHLDGVAVLHWHGDAFEIPDGAENLASTQLCGQQAFALGRNFLGVQFHPEAEACNGLEPWLVGHATELSTAGIDPRAIRADAIRHGARLREAGRAMFGEWLEGLEP